MAGSWPCEQALGLFNGAFQANTHSLTYQGRSPCEECSHSSANTLHHRGFPIHSNPSARHRIFQWSFVWAIRFLKERGEALWTLACLQPRLNFSMIRLAPRQKEPRSSLPTNFDCDLGSGSVLTRPSSPFQNFTSSGTAREKKLGKALIFDQMKMTGPLRSLDGCCTQVRERSRCGSAETSFIIFCSTSGDRDSGFEKECTSKHSSSSCTRNTTHRITCPP